MKLDDFIFGLGNINNYSFASKFDNYQCNGWFVGIG